MPGEDLSWGPPAALRGCPPVIMMWRFSSTYPPASIPAPTVTQPTGDAAATVETAPVGHSGDSADDPDGDGLGEGDVVRQWDVGEEVEGRVADNELGDLGPTFPHGVFICQHNTNTAPGTERNQNFKLVPLERVVGLVDDPPM
jgi:myo-inositol-hexaphosphate 3-phosphohydrolase